MTKYQVSTIFWGVEKKITSSKKKFMTLSVIRILRKKVHKDEIFRVSDWECNGESIYEFAIEFLFQYCLKKKLENELWLFSPEGFLRFRRKNLIIVRFCRKYFKCRFFQNLSYHLFIILMLFFSPQRHVLRGYCHSQLADFCTSPWLRCCPNCWTKKILKSLWNKCARWPVA